MRYHEPLLPHLTKLVRLLMQARLSCIILLFFMHYLNFMNHESVTHIIKGNISGANQPLRANRANFNLGHLIHIQGGCAGGVGGGICKSVIRSGG